MLALKNERCQKCRDERQVRYCLRIGKGLGYHCCNKLRVDLKCPPECSYTPQIPATGEALFPSCKVDSRTEFYDFMHHYADRWIHQPLPQLEGKTPQEVASADPDEMLGFLMQFQVPAAFPLDYLLKRLQINTQEPLPPLEDPETVATEFFDHVVAREWDKLPYFYEDNLVMPDARQRIAQLLSEINALKKCRAHAIINSGLSEDQNTAYVFLELNGKINWTIVLGKTDEGWNIKQSIQGTPQDYFAQNSVFTDIASEMAQGEFDKAEKQLYRIKDIYPASADVYYYYGFYYQWQKQKDKARDTFLKAVALDSKWIMPMLHLGLICMADKDYPNALHWFENADRLEPDNPVVLNNLGACLYGMGDLDRARQVWERAIALEPDFAPVIKNLEMLGDQL